MTRDFFRDIRYFFEYIGASILVAAIKSSPRFFVLSIARLAEKVIFLIPMIRRLVIANVATAFPEKNAGEIRRIASESIYNIALTVLDFFWFEGCPDRMERYVEAPADVRDMIKHFVNLKKGLIWVTPHLGSWELAGLKFRCISKMPFAVVVRPLNNPFLDRMISSARSSVGNRIIRDKGAVKGMIRALREGCFMATLIDQNTRGRDGGIFVNFFGLPASTSRAPAFFARKLGVPVAVGGCRRKGKSYELFAYPLSRQPDEFLSEEDMIQDIVKINESLIREYPEQYLWLYRRWLYIPNDCPEETRRRFPYYAKDVTAKFYDRNADKKENVKRHTPLGTVKK